jgi:hypothetical protein
LSGIRLKIKFYGGLFVKKAICAGRSSQVHEEVENASVATVFDVADVFKFIINRLNDSAFSQQDIIFQCHWPVFHIAFYAGYSVYPAVEKHFKKRSGNVSTVAKKFSKQLFFQYIKYFDGAVIRISRREEKTDCFTFIIADKMQFERILLGYNFNKQTHSHIFFIFLLLHIHIIFCFSAIYTHIRLFSKISMQR